MSLHRQLTEAFGGDRPRRIRRKLPEGPAGAGRAHEEDNTDPKSAVGFAWRRVDFCVVINASGEIVDIERPPWRPRGKRSGASMLAPQRPLRTPGSFSGFLWGPSAHALGLRRWGNHEDVRVDSAAFNWFRTFHRVALANARDSSLRAFLAFLDGWRPEWAFVRPELLPLAGGAVAFRFQYDEHFLHETHAARLVWRRLLNSNGALQEPHEAA